MQSKLRAEIQARHDADILNGWSHTVGGRQLHNHNDRGELLRMVEELEAELAETEDILKASLDKTVTLEAVIADVLRHTEGCDEYTSGDAARMVIRDVRKALKRGENSGN